MRLASGLALACALACAPLPASFLGRPENRIAGRLADRLRFLSDWPLSVKCQAVADAARSCLAEGLPPFCAWDGFSDRDEGIEGAVTLLACFERPECRRLGCDPTGKAFTVR